MVYASFILVILTLAGAFLYLYSRNKKIKSEYFDNEKQLKRKLYESNVLNELNERFGYSLDVERVIDVVSGSLNSLVSYSAVSYILLNGNRLVFKIILVEKVSNEYINIIQDRVKESLEALLSANLKNTKVEKFVTGEVLIGSDTKTPVASFFNIPLVVNNQVVGIFNVSSILSNHFNEPEVSLLYKVIEKATHTVTNLYEVLKREQTKLDVMVKNMSTGVLMMDTNFRILVVNDAFLSMLPLKKNKNTNIFDIVSAFGAEFPFEETVAKVLESQSPRVLSEVKINSRYFEVNIQPVKNADEVIGVGVILNDQSKEHEIQSLREDFTTMMIHELRSPLTVIRGISDFLMKEKDKLKIEQYDNLMNQVKKSSTNLLTIVNDLLDAAKVESGKFEVIKKTNDINELLHEEVKYYSGLASEKDNRITVETDKSIEKFAFDYQKLGQILNNLLSNAIKFTKGGEVKVVSRNLGREVEVSISDTGEGISDEMKSKLFNKFVQFRNSAVSNVDGTGLGLVIAKGIVEAHGGKIWIVDNVPHGSRFLFTLPYA